jgi:Zn-dependent M28 family amino/carboxypeptidase
MNHKRNKRAAAVAAVVVLALGTGVPAQASGGKDKGIDTEDLREAVSVKNILEHLEELQDVADENNGNRAAGTTGYEETAEYIEDELRDAGYKPKRQYFDYDKYVLNSQAFEQVSPTAIEYTAGEHYNNMAYSGAGNVTAVATAVDLKLTDQAASTSGCEAEDFTGFPAGNIALLQRGTCPFGDKVANAAAAGASAAVIMNQGNGEPGSDRNALYSGTLGAPQKAIPAVSTSYEFGVELAETQDLELRIVVDADIINTETFNVLADTKGQKQNTVVVGAHLDSVGEGPGINDNGSGTAAILETAIQMAESGDKPRNRVRFAFWGAEEDGLLGSTHYVAQLSEDEIKQHMLNLNFDMVGSPNGGRFVYDGDGDAFNMKGPEGSAEIEHLFEDYFSSKDLASAPTAFSGRSDYAAFINAGIPAGGLFTGAEGIMTEEEAKLFDGEAGKAYDPNYHQAGDDIDNINEDILDEMADAIAHATLTYAETKSNGKGHDKDKGKGGKHGPQNMDHRGHDHQR